jgi:hypothetical protein
MFICNLQASSTLESVVKTLVNTDPTVLADMIRSGYIAPTPKSSVATTADLVADDIDARAF